MEGRVSHFLKIVTLFKSYSYSFKFFVENEKKVCFFNFKIPLLLNKVKIGKTVKDS